MFLLGICLLQVCIIHLPSNLRSLALPFLSTEGLATTKLCHQINIQSYFVSCLPKPYTTQWHHTCASLTNVPKGKPTQSKPVKNRGLFSRWSWACYDHLKVDKQMFQLKVIDPTQIIFINSSLILPPPPSLICGMSSQMYHTVCMMVNRLYNSSNFIIHPSFLMFCIVVVFPYKVSTICLALNYFSWTFSPVSTVFYSHRKDITESKDLKTYFKKKKKSCSPLVHPLSLS